MQESGVSIYSTDDIYTKSRDDTDLCADCRHSRSKGRKLWETPMERFVRFVGVRIEVGLTLNVSHRSLRATRCHCKLTTSGLGQSAVSSIVGANRFF